MDSPSLRVYGGVPGDDRRAERRAQLIEAGLDLLGGSEGEPSLTVRGVCKRAGLAARYFYESFPDRDALALAVVDHVVEGIAGTTLAAVQAAGPDARAKVHAGLDNIVRTVAGDPRQGRLLFSPNLSNSSVARRRVESARLFAGLLGGQLRDFYGIADSTRLALITEFLVGGLAQTLTTWLNGGLAIGRPELVEHCTEVFLSIGVPRTRSEPRPAG